MQPASVGARHNAFCAQDNSVAFVLIQSAKNTLNLLLCKLFGRFNAPALEDFICIMSMMMVMVMFMRILIMMMMVAGTVGIITFLTVMVMVVMFMFVCFIVVMVVMMLVRFIMVVMVFMLMRVIVVMMVMVAGAVGIVTFLVVLVPMLMLNHLRKLFGQRILVLHCVQNLLAAELIPRGCDNHRIFVVLTQQGNGCVELVL